MFNILCSSTDHGQIAGDHGIPTTPDKLETPLGILVSQHHIIADYTSSHITSHHIIGQITQYRRVEVIKEYSSNPLGNIPVLYPEVIVTPGLELGSSAWTGDGGDND